MNTPNLQLYIADDNEGFAEFCNTVSAKEGCSPVSCRDGAELLDALRSGTGPALVICDLNMPNLDGVQVAQALPEIQRNLRIRFITGGDQRFALAAHMISEINDMFAALSTLSRPSSTCARTSTRFNSRSLITTHPMSAHPH